MHVGVFGGVGVMEPIEHRLRLLRRGGVVEIDQRLAVDRHREDRKILADARDVVGAVADRRDASVVLGAWPRRRRKAGSRQAATLIDQRVAQAGVLDPLDRLADERLDQQRLGLTWPECRAP